MSFSLAGKVAVVTGGSSGIGAAVVARFLEAGASVVSFDRVGRAPAGAVEVVGDVSVEADVAGVIALALERFGRLDVVVNNAGIQPLGVGFDGLSRGLLERTFEVNVNGVAFGMKHASGAMENSGGAIVNMSSFVGLLGVPGGTAYAASKAAVAHLTRCAAVELADRGIRVNAVAPGTIRTPAVEGIEANPEIPFVEGRTPLGRLGEADEVATAVQFLASDAAGYVTGVVLPVDGGISAGWERYDLAVPANVKGGEWRDDA